MKSPTPHHPIRQLSLFAGISLAAFILMPQEASAQRKAGRGFDKRGLGNRGGQIFGFNIGELGAIRDKVAAHKRLTLGGAGFYNKDNHELRGAHFKTYMLIRNSLVEDRIDEAIGRTAVDELIEIGTQAQKQQDENGRIPDEQAAKIRQQIASLASRIKEAREAQVNPDTLTPKLNERQVTMEELYRYCVDSDSASQGQAASLRRKLDSLEQKEANAKKGGSISDRNREKLMEECIEIWKAFAQVLKD